MFDDNDDKKRGWSLTRDFGNAGSTLSRKMGEKADGEEFRTVILGDKMLRTKGGMPRTFDLAVKKVVAPPPVTACFTGPLVETSFGARTWYPSGTVPKLISTDGLISLDIRPLQYVNMLQNEDVLKPVVLCFTAAGSGAASQPASPPAGAVIVKESAAREWYPEIPVHATDVNGYGLHYVVRRIKSITLDFGTTYGSAKYTFSNIVGGSPKTEHGCLNRNLVEDGLGTRTIRTTSGAQGLQNLRLTFETKLGEFRFASPSWFMDYHGGPSSVFERTQLKELYGSRPEASNLSKAVMFGNMWHGKCTPDGLVLEGGTEPTLIPDYDGVSGGNTYLVQSPLLTEPVANPASVTAIGAAFKNYAILSGPFNRYSCTKYSKGLNDIIHFDADGVAWAMSAQAHANIVEDYYDTGHRWFTFRRLESVNVKVYRKGTPFNNFSNTLVADVTVPVTALNPPENCQSFLNVVGYTTKVIASPSGRKIAVQVYRIQRTLSDPVRYTECVVELELSPGTNGTFALVSGRKAWQHVDSNYETAPLDISGTVTVTITGIIDAEVGRVSYTRQDVGSSKLSATTVTMDKFLVLCAYVGETLKLVSGEFRAIYPEVTGTWENSSTGELNLYRPALPGDVGSTYSVDVISATRSSGKWFEDPDLTFNSEYAAFYLDVGWAGYAMNSPPVTYRDEFLLDGNVIDYGEGQFKFTEPLRVKEFPIPPTNVSPASAYQAAVYRMRAYELDVFDGVFNVAMLKNPQTTTTRIVTPSETITMENSLVPAYASFNPVTEELALSATPISFC